MDVDKIGAVTPRRIDWQKLTSKEIIKYESEGLDVPSQYLQWAKEFINDVNAKDKDDTTYEIAHSGQVKDQAENETNTNAGLVQNAESENASVTGIPTDNGQPESKNKAQLKRELLEDVGIGLRGQSLILTEDSKAAYLHLLGSIIKLEIGEKHSDNEISKLENHMVSLLEKAEAKQGELRNEVDKINNNHNEGGNAFEKIGQLEKELERYGGQGQVNAAQTNGQILKIESEITGEDPNILNAEAFGAEAKSVGQELIDSTKHKLSPFWLIDQIIGRRAIFIGGKTAKRAEKTAAKQHEASSLNNTNERKVNDIKNQVQDKTGVEAIKSPKKADETSKNDQNALKQNPSAKTEEQATANASDPTVQAEKVANGDIDAILKAKIRRGENIEPT